MSTPPSIPTLDDVARAAGVSTATVSRCLNEQQKVSPQTRERVMQAVNALGYTPNFNARAMAAKRTHTIGAIIPTMENAMFARGLQAFQETLHAAGYNLLVSSSAYDAALEGEQVRALVARGADGVLLIGFDRPAETYAFLERRAIPAVLAWTTLPDLSHATVGFDNRAAMGKLTDHVISLGHKDIAVISGILAGNDRARGRVRGIKDSLAAHGLNPDALPLIETPYSMENGGAAFEALMQADTKPTVVICGNDVLAAGALAKARDMGLSVPDDVSVTGFDDLEIASFTHPPLTTVHVPHRDMGTIAARELIAMIEDSAPIRNRQLDVEIILRGSLKAR